MDKLNRLLVIDGTTVFKNIYFEYLKYETKQQMSLIRYLDFLTSAIRQFKPDGLIIVYEDGEVPSVKEARNTEGRYISLSEQIVGLRRFLSRVNVQCVEMAGFTCREKLASLAKRCRDENTEAIILTEDNKLLKLVSPRVSVAITSAGEIGEISSYKDSAKAGHIKVIHENAVIEDELTAYSLPLARKDYSPEKSELYQHIDRLAIIPWQKQDRLLQAERRAYSQSIYSFSCAVYISSELQGRPTYSNRVQAAVKLYIDGKYLPKQAADAMGIRLKDLLAKLKHTAKYQDTLKKDQENLNAKINNAIELYMNSGYSLHELSEVTKVDYSALLRALPKDKDRPKKYWKEEGTDSPEKTFTPYDEQKMREALCMYFNSDYSIHELSEITNIAYSTLLCAIPENMKNERKRKLKEDRKRVHKSDEERRMREALRMYSNAYIAFSEICEVTGISSSKLLKYVTSHRIEKVRRISTWKPNIPRKNVDAVNGLILSGKSVKEVAILLEMNVRTVRRHISDEVWREHLRSKKSQRNQTAPDIKSKKSSTIRKAVRMYMNASVSFSEIRMETGVGRARLEKYLARNGIEKIRRRKIKASNPVQETADKPKKVMGRTR